MGKSKLKVIILTEGGIDIGHGHVTRCISIYQAFERMGIKPVLIINGDNTVIPLVNSLNYKILDWLDLDIMNVIREANIVIVDSYRADLSLYTRISESVPLVVYIDDNNRVPYPKGVIVNGSIYAKEIGYTKRRETFYLLGTKYIPLRKEFWCISEKVINETMKTVMITFGGDDMRGLTHRVLDILNEEFPQLIKKVIVGRGFNEQNIKNIENMKDDRTEIVYFPSAKVMKDIMMKSDIAISAGGQTLYELARIGTPVVAIAIADNQLCNVLGWAKVGFIEYAGWWEDRHIFDKIAESVRKLLPMSERERRYLIGRRFVDGKGSFRVVNYLLSNYKKWTE